jgi:hypothetical protein
MIHPGVLKHMRKIGLLKCVHPGHDVDGRHDQVTRLLPAGILPAGVGQLRERLE